ncbi:MAG: hypothetical protein ACKO4M_09310 [Betaproteobacteria bacterium]
MIRYLLDTNIVIYVIKKRPLEVMQAFNRHSGRMAISSVTHARSEGLVLVTNNLREFERVPALETENWISSTV